MRPIIVTLIGYMVMLDAALNTFGWAIDLFANHTYVSRIFLPTWGNMFDAGYFWHYNELAGRRRRRRRARRRGRSSGSSSSSRCASPPASASCR